tara:strand:- start:959 stop:1462 length:504 start_codon:yes stop_codon:yes gene_type:complete
MRLILIFLLIINAHAASAQGVRLNPDDFGPAPVFNWAKATPSMNGRMPAPPSLGACISRDERNRALRNVSYDCSCTGYAAALKRQTWDRSQDLVCGIQWYACWAPVPSDQTVRDRFLSGFADYSPADRALLNDDLMKQVSTARALDEMRDGQVSEDALAWDTARACE